MALGPSSLWTTGINSSSNALWLGATDRRAVDRHNRMRSGVWSCEHYPWSNDNIWVLDAAAVRQELVQRCIRDLDQAFGVGTHIVFHTRPNSMRIRTKEKWLISHEYISCRQRRQIEEEIRYFNHAPTIKKHLDTATPAPSRFPFQIGRAHV